MNHDITHDYETKLSTEELTKYRDALVDFMVYEKIRDKKYMQIIREINDVNARISMSCLSEFRNRIVNLSEEKRTA